MRWIPLTLIFGALVAHAQNTPPLATPAGSEQKIRVEGTILSMNGEAVRKATVRLLGMGGNPGSRRPVIANPRTMPANSSLKISRPAAICCRPRKPAS